MTAVAIRPASRSRELFCAACGCQALYLPGAFLHAYVADQDACPGVLVDPDDRTVFDRAAAMLFAKWQLVTGLRRLSWSTVEDRVRADFRCLAVYGMAALGDGRDGVVRALRNVSLALSDASLVAGPEVVGGFADVLAGAAAVADLVG